MSTWILILGMTLLLLWHERIAEANCPPSSCGNIHNITFPFRLQNDPKHCGNSRYTLYCDNNLTTLHLYSGKYLVREINYRDQKLRVVDPGLQNNNCSSTPRYPLAFANVSYLEDIYTPILSSPVTFFKCRNPVKSPLYVDVVAPCVDTANSSFMYVKLDRTAAAELEDGCKIYSATMVMTSYLNKKRHRNFSYQDIHKAMVYGFELEYQLYTFVNCGENTWTSYGEKCFSHDLRGYVSLLFSPGNELLLIIVIIVFSIVVKFIIGAPLVIALLINKWRKRHWSMYSTIEDFLHNDNNFGPIRYSYSDIKKMSNDFKNRLGEGGYGTVFKAKLQSGRFGAIKMLGKSKANGQDFINEVATIGTIHHVNVVQLVGYCVEGSKQALVYEFMPNGSLDKHIFSKERSVHLSCKNMYDISLGIARGIDYLHEGCNMQILHFDIKPHNILLDENFNPKVSDFGLAKLYPTDNSIVSLTAARGTMGYIAPELFYKNIGGVSYKADVYSFGMLLMEMASKRKNFDPHVEHLSQTFFPSWVYDHYKEGKYLEMGDVIDEEEKKIVKKMIITALWCIQMKPSDRPSMNKVIDMLERDVECLQMPPKPFLYEQDMPVGNIPNNFNIIDSNVELTWTLSGR